MYLISLRLFNQIILMMIKLCFLLFLLTLLINVNTTIVDDN